MKWLPLWITRIATGTLFALVALELTRSLGTFPALFSIAALAGAVCLAAAALLRRQPPGKISTANYLVAILLPLGYRPGRGRLSVIVIASWAGWTGVGFAVVIRKITGGVPLLQIAWLLDGLALVFLLSSVIRHLIANARRPAFALLRICGGIAVIIVGSAWLSRRGHGILALLLAGGPIALAATAYALFLLMLLITRPRWN